MNTLEKRLREAIRDIPDYPKPGVLFRDITPIWANAALFTAMVNEMVKQLSPLEPTVIAGTEARGFIMGGALAHALGCKFVPIRKSGKLPFHTVKQSYSLEYGEATIEMHEDAVSKEDRVIIHDDLLATGGTAIASAKLIQRLNSSVVGFSFIVNLEFLKGSTAIENSFGLKPHYLVQY
jgi:adenine phosphoribosyltransferase